MASRLTSSAINAGGIQLINNIQPAARRLLVPVLAVATLALALSLTTPRVALLLLLLGHALVGVHYRRVRVPTRPPLGTPLWGPCGVRLVAAVAILPPGPQRLLLRSSRAVVGGRTPPVWGRGTVAVARGRRAAAASRRRGLRSAVGPGRRRLGLGLRVLKRQGTLG